MMMSHQTEDNTMTKNIKNNKTEIQKQKNITEILKITTAAQEQCLAGRSKNQ